MVRRVLHITTFLQGGAGRVVAALACGQRQAGLDVAVACAAGGVAGYDHYPAWLAQLRAADVPVLPVACTFRRELHHLMGAVSALEHTEFVANGLDLVHAHAAVPALVARTFRHRAPVLATMHGWNARKAQAHADTDIAIFNGLPTVAVPSPAAGQHLVAAGLDADRLTVVPYGVEPQPAAGLAADAATLLGEWRRRGRRVAVCVGSVGVRKRQDDLLRALTTPGLRGTLACAFAGESDDLHAWRERARAYGVDADVAFLGYRADVGDWMRAADLLVFPSEREGLPIGLLEAQALGAVCVVSDIDEHTGVVSHGRNGFVYRVGAVDALADALRRAITLSDSERRAIDCAAQLHWRRTHRPELMLARYGALYDAVAVRHGERGALSA